MLDRKTVAAFGLGVVVTVVVGAAGPVSGSHVRNANAGNLSRDVFHRAVDDILDRHVEPVDEPKALAAGLQAVAGRLDPHSYYLSADERRELRERLDAGGVTGLELALRSHEDNGTVQRTLEIVAVETGSPAAKAGLRAGDHVVRLDGRAPAELPHAAAVETLLHGPPGGTLTLVVQRRGEPSPKTVVLERRRLPARPHVAAKVVTLESKRVLVLRIERFSRGTGEAVKRALKRHGSVSGVLLDVRGNPGGIVDEALVVADLFVDKGLLTRTRGRGGRILREEHAHPSGSQTQVPLVVLQDVYTASAAELLAAALHDHARARLVGQRSYGKGTIQQVIGLSDGSLLNLTIARYRSPSDRVIDGVGVEPDVHVADAAAIWTTGLHTLAEQVRT